MSKRHQASRRKSYGRRQHEVHERYLRRRDHELLDTRVDTFGSTGRAEAFGFDFDAPARTFSFSPVD
jgi:hypothetical protein